MHSNSSHTDDQTNNTDAYQKISGVYGGYVATSADDAIAVEFFNSKKTMFCYIDKKDVLYTATTNCVTFADPRTGEDKTIEGMADLLMKAEENFFAIGQTIDEGNRCSLTLKNNLQSAQRYNLEN